MDDIFYFANIVLFVLALIAGRHVPHLDSARHDDSPGRLSLWLPLVPVAIAAVFVVVYRREAMTEPTVAIAGLVLIVASPATSPRFCPAICVARFRRRHATYHPDPSAGTPGMLADSEFAAGSRVMAPGSQILLYSDGVLGEPPRLEDFAAR